MWPNGPADSAARGRAAAASFSRVLHLIRARCPARSPETCVGKMKALQPDKRSSRTMGRWFWFVLSGLTVCLSPTTSAAARNDIRLGRVSRLQVDGAPRVKLASEVSCPDDSGPCMARLHWAIPSADHPRDAVLLLASGQVQSVTLGGAALGHQIDEEGGGRPVRLDFVLPASQEPLELEIAATLQFEHVGPTCGFGMSFDLATQRHWSQHSAAIDIQLDAQAPVDPYVERNLQRADDPPGVEYAEPPEA